MTGRRMDTISRLLLEQTPQLREQFAGARPFRAVVLEPFFEATFYDQLLAEFPPFDTRRALNENGEAGGVRLPSARCVTSARPTPPWTPWCRALSSWTGCPALPVSTSCNMTPTTFVYVERPLPALYQPGLTLEESHLNELTTLLQRRDQHLERLYRDSQDLLAQVTAGRRALYSLDVVQEDPAVSPADLSAQDALVRRIQQLEATLGVVLKSPFWRVTAPLRWLHRKLRNLLLKRRR
ncbi:MAG: hypothetical protein AAGA23_08745 [Pseudomonadota bacterium]